MTAGELVERLRAILDEETEGFYEDKELYNWLEEGHKEVARRAKHLTSRRYIEPVEQEYYVLPDDFVELLKVRYGQKWLNEVPLEEDGQSEGYYTWGDRLFLSKIEGGKILIYYYRLPDRELSEESDMPEIPKAYETILIPFALARGFQKDKKMDLAQLNMQEYQERLVGMRRNLDNRPSRRQWIVKRR